MVCPPAAIFVFNRPHLVSRAIAPLATLRPGRLFVVADRGRTPSEHEIVGCSVKAAEESVSWPCHIQVLMAEHHLGCRRRFETGLDTLFDLVSAAIILEDDVEVSPAFLQFAAVALPMFAADPSVRSISARNVLIRQRDTTRAFLARKESIWGWATWADRWKSYRQNFPIMPAEALNHGIRCHAAHQLHCDLQCHLSTSRLWEKIDTWDIPWSLYNLATDGWTLTPPWNLAINHGMGIGATHTHAPDDVRAAFPLFHDIPPINPSPVRLPDYDRDFTLLEIVLNMNSPRHWKALAKSGARRPAKFAGPGWNEMLAAFHHRAAVANLLAHLQQHISHPQLDSLAAVFSAET